MEKTKKHPLRLTGQIMVIALFILAVLAGLAILGFRLYMMLPVMPYYNASEKAFEIPGLAEGLVPQGFCYDAEKEYFLVSGYSATDEASAVYVVDKASGETVTGASLLKEDGSAFKGHAGGVAQYGDYVYIAGSSGHCLYVYSYAEILAADSVKCKGKFSLEAAEDDYVGASFVSAENGRLIVGEFHMEPNYQTLDSHKMTTADGEMHGAFAVEFALSEAATFGIEPTPVRAYSLRDKVQGVSFTDGKIYLSTSYGLSYSYIYRYDEAELTEEGNVAVLGTSVPLLSFDSAALEATYKVPPMSEELVMLEGELYIMCESASSKYIFGKFTEGRWCFKTDLGELKTESAGVIVRGDYWEDESVLIVRKRSDVDASVILAHYDNGGIVLVMHWTLAGSVQEILRGAVTTGFTSEDAAVAFYRTRSDTTGDTTPAVSIVGGNATHWEREIDDMIAKIKAKQ